MSFSLARNISPAMANQSEESKKASPFSFHSQYSSFKTPSNLFVFSLPRGASAETREADGHDFHSSSSSSSSSLLTTSIFQAKGAPVETIRSNEDAKLKQILGRQSVAKHALKEAVAKRKKRQLLPVLLSESNTKKGIFEQNASFAADDDSIDNQDDDMLLLSDQPDVEIGQQWIDPTSPKEDDSSEKDEKRTAGISLPLTNFIDTSDPNSFAVDTSTNRGIRRQASPGLRELRTDSEMEVSDETEIPQGLTPVPSSYVTQLASDGFLTDVCHSQVQSIPHDIDPNTGDENHFFDAIDSISFASGIERCGLQHGSTQSCRNRQNYGTVKFLGQIVNRTDDALSSSSSDPVDHGGGGRFARDILYRHRGEAQSLIGSDSDSDSDADWVNPYSQANDVQRVRRGPEMWSRAKNRLDSIILRGKELELDPIQSDHSDFHTVRGKAKRRATQAKIKADRKREIKKGMNFSSSSAMLAIFAYLLVATVAYCFVFEPDWTPIDSAYFAMVTLTTVGYGDLTPSNDASRMFTCFYSLGGLSCLGIALGILGSNLIEAQSNAVSQASALSKIQVMTLFGDERKVQGSSILRFGGETPDFDDYDNMSDDELEREIMRIHGGDESKSPRHDSRLVMLLPMVLLLFFASFFIAEEAEWDIPRIIYFFVTTSATIGYGDAAPRSQIGRLYAIFFIPITVVTMGEWLSTAAKIIIERRHAEFRKKYAMRELTLSDLEIMNEDGNTVVTRAEYIQFMLVAMNEVNSELLSELNAQFDHLDVDGTGTLEKNDLVVKAKKKLRSARRKLELATYKKHLVEIGRGQENKIHISPLATLKDIQRGLSNAFHNSFQGI